MMNMMAAFCITVLFSGWVWSLKHELAEMQKRISPAAQTSPESLGVGHRIGRTTSSGMPTWTIE
ncbi:MAG: hypothetical protein KJ726_00505 [Verrucomicrobia bacterium]|nr:hypothetical protein [Verrucomicrobiota bacterium]MBU1908510.1 hypothetical protein [Verrucomicrobiota bacterium]